MENPLSLVAERVRGLRQMMDIPLEEMAAVTDSTVEEYAAFEEGRVDANFTFLFKCAVRLGVDLSELVTGDDPKLSFYTVTRKGEGMPIKRRAGFDYQHLAAMLKNRLSEPFVVTAKYSEEEQHAPIHLSTHEGQEMDFVLSGALKVQLEDHTEVLHAGDSVYYDASHRHGMIAVEGEDCQFLAVVVRGGEMEYRSPEEQTKVVKPADRELLYKQFVHETLDENGHLKDITFQNTEQFNFGFDVVDALGKNARISWP